MIQLFKHRVLLITLASVAALGLIGIVVSVLVNQETVYQGKRASEWVNGLGTPGERESRAALKALGANATIPYLVRAIGRKETRLSRLYRSLLPKLPGILRTHLPMPADFERIRRVRHGATSFLLNSRTDANAALPRLIRLLHDEDADVRIDAALAMMDLGESAEPALPTIIKLLNEKEGKVNHPLFKMLNNIGPKARAAMPALVETLQDKDPSIRVWAADSLWKIDPQQADVVRPILSEALKEKNPGTRMDAANTLWEIDRSATTVVPVLIELIEQKGHSFSSQAIWLLGVIGPEAKAAVPVIQTMLTNYMSAETATNALKRIVPEAATGPNAVVPSPKDPGGSG